VPDILFNEVLIQEVSFPAHMTPPEGFSFERSEPAVHLGFHRLHRGPV